MLMGTEVFYVKRNRNTDKTCFCDENEGANAPPSGTQIGSFINTLQDTVLDLALIAETAQHPKTDAP